MPASTNFEQQRSLAAEFHQVLRILRRQVWIILLCVFIAGGAGYALASSQNTKYEASAQMLVQPFAQDLTLPNAPAAFSDPTRARATALQLITSPAVSRRVVESLHPRTVGTKISATSNGDSDVVSVTADAPSAVEAAQLANAYATQYIAYRRETNKARYLAAAKVIARNLANENTAGAGQTQAKRAAHLKSLAALREQGARLHLYAATQTGDAQVVQPASVPSRPVPRDQVRTGLLGSGFGLLLGLGLAFLREKLSDRITGEDDLLRLTPELPVIGYIPSGRGAHSNPAIGDGYHGLNASLAVVRPSRGRVLLVTSGSAEDGKSTTAVNLALAMQERHSSVLLVDADLRRPKLSDDSRVDGQRPGLVEVLAGAQALGPAVQQASFEPTTKSSDGPRVALSGDIRVLPAGGPTARPQVMFTDRSVEAFMRGVRSTAETVIIDGPPLGVVADMLSVAKAADDVLIVVRLGNSRARPLRRLMDQLDNAGVTPAGLVVIGGETGEYYYR